MTRVPVTILGGFLGSGKTTLLNELLQQDHGKRIGVIVNEFGQVGIDGSLVSGGETFVELDNGCLCCVLSEDLDRTLIELKAQGDLDALVVETTGLADPLPIAWNFSKPEVSDYFRVDAIACVVDCLHVARSLEESAEAVAQVERADILIFNKLDLVSDGGKAAKACVTKHNQGAVLVDRKPESWSWDLLVDQIELTSDRALPKVAGPALHSHYRSYVFQTPQVLSELAVEDLLLDLPMSVYRCKGIVNTDAPWGWTEVHTVAGRYDARPWENQDERTESTLVFIGQNICDDELRGLCEKLVVDDAAV